MNPNPLTDSRNRNFLITGIAAIVALITFFLTYVSISYSYTSTFTGTTTSSAYPLSGNQVAQWSGILWLGEILIAAVIAACALFIFRPYNPFGITTVPVAKLARWTAFGLIGVGALNLLFTFIALSSISSQLNYGLTTPDTGGYAVSWGFGGILTLLASAVIAGGGVLMVMNKTIGAGAASYYTAQSPYQNNPYAQQSQYPPAGYPPQQPPSYPGGYPQQPQYPAQPQYPPTQYPSQTQYPPQQQPPQYPQ